MLNLARELPKTLILKSIIVIAVTAVSAFLVSLWPVKLGEILDSISSEAFSSFNTSFLYTLATAGIIYLLSNILPVQCRVATNRIVAQFEATIRDISNEKFLHIPIEYLRKEGKSAELTSKLNMAINGSSQLLRLIIGDIIVTFLVVVFIIWQAVIQTPCEVAGTMFVYIVISFSVSLGQIKSQKGVREKIVTERAKLDGDVCQTFQGIEQIRVMSAEPFEHSRLSPKVEKIRRAETRHHTVMGSFDSIKQFIKASFFIFLIMYCLYLVSRGIITTGTTITAILLFQQLLSPIDSVYRFIDEIASAATKMSVMKRVFNTPCDPIFSIGSTNKEIAGDIEVSHFSVYAPNQSKAELVQLEHLVLQESQIRTIDWPSGTGKSSLIKGLLRFYPSSGSVVIGGVDRAELPQSQLTNLICYTPQKSRFFEGSIRENLVYGIKNPPSDASLLEALQKACLIEELKTLNNTPLDIALIEGGDNLSVGQQQRLAIARAFLRKPKFFVFDESTANVDLSTKNTILANLEQHAHSISAGILYITHDMDIITRYLPVGLVNRLTPAPIN